LTDIYAASENPIPGVGIENIFKGVKKNGIENVSVIDKDAIADYIGKIAKAGDCVLVLGAGDINEIIPSIVKSINENRKQGFA